MMKRPLIFFLVLWLTSTLGFCGEKMRRLQEELRKRNLYFGEIDGHASDELQKALAHYQQVKGFTVSGTVDADTAISLGIRQPDPVAAALPSPLPDEPVLKSDAARELTAEERKVVEQIQTVDAPSSPLDGPWRAVEPTPTAPATPATPAQSPAFASEKVEAFLRQYLAACESNDLDAEMAYYAPSVDYFDHGRRQHDFIRRDVAAYYKRWPTRHYELAEVQIRPGPREEEKTVQFRLRFSVAHGQAHATGQTENRFEVRHEGQAMKFVSLKEQRLRDPG